MFRKFDPSADVSTSTQVKASVQRAIKSQIGDANPALTEEILDELLPKKDPLVQYKVGPHLMLYCQHVESQEEGVSASDIPVFFQHRDGPVLPTLKFVHQYPTVKFMSVTVDKGAIPYLLGGANVMCPGLTNPGGALPEDTTDEDGHVQLGLDKGAGVVIFAEGKQHALAIGVMSLSSAEM
jgi:malignant T-cell-amplified sequence